MRLVVFALLRVLAGGLVLSAEVEAVEVQAPLVQGLGVRVEVHPVELEASAEGAMVTVRPDPPVPGLGAKVEVLLAVWAPSGGGLAGPAATGARTVGSCG